MKFAKIDKSTAATHEIVAAIAGRRIRLLGYLLVAAGSQTATWQSGSTTLTGAMSMAVGVPLSHPAAGDSMDILPAMQTEPGEALQLTLSQGVQVSGHIVYDVVGSP